MRPNKDHTAIILERYEINTAGMCLKEAGYDFLGESLRKTLDKLLTRTARSKQKETEDTGLELDPLTSDLVYQSLCKFIATHSSDSPEYNNVRQMVFGY